MEELTLTPEEQIAELKCELADLRSLVSKYHEHVTTVTKLMDQYEETRGDFVSRLRLMESQTKVGLPGVQEELKALKQFVLNQHGTAAWEHHRLLEAARRGEL